MPDRSARLNNLLIFIQRIETETLLSPATFEVDLEEALDQRDRPEFDAQWTRVHSAIQSMDIPAEERSSLDKLRELAFKQTFGITKNGEAAAYVSDDFGLIGAALLVGVSDDWLNALWLEYLNQRFPYGSFPVVPGTLRELIQ